MLIKVGRKGEGRICHECKIVQTELRDGPAVCSRPGEELDVCVIYSWDWIRSEVVGMTSEILLSSQLFLFHPSLKYNKHTLSVLHSPVQSQLDKHFLLKGDNEAPWESEILKSVGNKDRKTSPHVFHWDPADTESLI